MFSMYFDDGTMQDWADSAKESQAALADLMETLGSPWAIAKRQKVGQTGDFLGLVHDLSQIGKRFHYFLAPR